MASEPPRAELPGTGLPGAELPSARRGWWLEDATPGRVLRHPGGRTVGEAEHVWLAWATHNVGDLHGDVQTARRSGWDGPIVLGMLSAAMVIGLAEPAVPPPALAGLGLSRGWRSIRLTAAVRPGDTLRAESEIRAVRDSPGGASGCVFRTIRGYDQRDTVVAIIEEEREVPRRPTDT
jgi:acyl dehydratase